MALINCPECSKEISDRAEACIHCGFPLKQHEEPKQVEFQESFRFKVTSISEYQNSLQILGELEQGIIHK